MVNESQHKVRDKQINKSLMGIKDGNAEKGKQRQKRYFNPYEVKGSYISKHGARAHSL